jgi:hypothetical protein
MPKHPEKGIRVRFAEYDFVTRQSKKGGVCPFCDVLHSPTNGLAVEGDCPGIYIRRRKAAFVVVGLKKGRAGVVGREYVTPTGRNLDRAVAHAEKDWSER